MTYICLSIGVMGGSAPVPSLGVPSIIAVNPCTALFALRTTIAYCSHRQRQLIMPKITGHGHVSTLADEGTCKTEKTVKECTGGGLVEKPPMLKSDVRYLNQNIYFESIEVRKECIPWFGKLLALYRRLQASSRLFVFNGFLCLDL